MFRTFINKCGALKALKQLNLKAHHHTTLVSVSGMFAVQQHNIQFCRHKSKGGKKAQQDQTTSGSESEDGKDDFENRITDKNTKIMDVNLKSLRVDLLLKTGLGLARNKIETQFYESKIRVNGKKLLKKSEEAQEGDEIDVVKSASPSNPDFLIVARVEVLSVKQKADMFNVKLRRCKSLTIENYERESD